MPKKFSNSYKQIKNSRSRSSSRASFALFSRSKNRPRRIRSESDRASSVFFGGTYGPRKRNTVIFPKINKKTLVLLFIAILLITWLGVLLFSPFFNIKETRITGLKNIRTEEVKPIIENYLSKKSWHFFNNRNFFIVSDTKLISELSNHFYVENIQITKIFPNQIHVDIQEKISSIIYDNGSNYVILDENGTVVKNVKSCTDECISTSSSTLSTLQDSTSSTVPFVVSTTSITTPVNSTHIPKYDSFAIEYLNIPVVYDTQHPNVTVGNKYVLLPETIKIIETIYTKDRKNEKKFNILYFVLDGPGSGVRAITDKGFSVFYSPENDLDSQFNFVSVVLKDNKPKEYIDVRYANRVFWK